VLATVLTIIIDGEATATVHQDESGARDALRHFVDQCWANACPGAQRPQDVDVRIAAFFVRETASYDITEADIGDLAEALGGTDGARWSGGRAMIQKPLPRHDS